MGARWDFSLDWEQLKRAGFAATDANRTVEVPSIVPVPVADEL